MSLSACIFFSRLPQPHVACLFQCRERQSSPPQRGSFFPVYCLPSAFSSPWYGRQVCGPARGSHVACTRAAFEAADFVVWRRGMLRAARPSFWQKSGTVLAHAMCLLRQQQACACPSPSGRSTALQSHWYSMCSCTGPSPALPVTA